MAKRSVQFDMNFDIDGLNTIGALEDELTAINEQLKYVDVNSDAFKELSKQAQQADGKLRTINDSLDGVTGPERAEGLVKLADGLVGAFQIAAGASLIFGEKTSEQLEKVIAKVGGLFAAMDGIKKVTEAVSAQNLKFLKSTVTGFQKSAVAAKLFGTTARAAITATGIGLLVIGVAALIANFDKVSAWFKKNFQPIIDGFQKLRDIVVGIGGALKAAFTGDDIKEGYANAIETHERLNELKDEYNDLIEDTKDGYDDELELLSLQGDKEQEIIDKKRERNTFIVDNLKKQRELNDLTEEQVEELRDAEQELKKLDILQDKLNKKNAEAAKVEKEKAEARAQAAADLRKQAAEQAKAQQEQLAATQQAVRDAQAQAIAGEKDLYFQRDILDVKNQLFELNGDITKDQERLTEINEILLSNNEELIFLDQERQKVKNDLKITEEERAARLENINQAELGYIQQVNDKAKNYLSTLNQEQQELLRISLLEESRLLNSKDSLEAEKQKAEANKEYADTVLEAAEAGLEEAETAEDIAFFKEKIAEYELKSAEAANDLIQAEVNLLKNTQATNAEQAKQNQLIAEGAKAAEGFVEIQETALQSLQGYLSDYADEIQASIEIVNQSFEIINNLKENEFLLDQERRQRELDEQKAILDELTDYTVEKKEEINEANQELAEEEEELNDLLRDAEGDRYDDILDQLNQVRAAKAANAAEEARLEKEQAKAQYKYDLAVWEKEKAFAKGKDDAAKAEKTQAIINGLIQTTLAVVEALPNIPLSIIAGVLGAAGVAVIASQSIPKTPVPPKPKPPAGLAEGGYTKQGGKYEPAGIVHAGEWVAPQTLVNDPVAGEMIATLEGMRKGYAEGGTVTATSVPTTVTSDNNFDYQQLTNSLITGLKSNPMFVSVVEFRDVENRLSVVEDRSSI